MDTTVVVTTQINRTYLKNKTKDEIIDLLLYILDTRCEADAEIERLREELSTMTAYADKLADGLPMLPKDVEVIRDANWQFAQENFDLKAEIERLRAVLELMTNKQRYFLTKDLGGGNIIRFESPVNLYDTPWDFAQYELNKGG